MKPEISEVEISFGMLPSQNVPISSAFEIFITNTSTSNMGVPEEWWNSVYSWWQCDDEDDGLQWEPAA